MTLFPGSVRDVRAEARNGWDWYLSQFGYGGNQYPLHGIQLSYGANPAEPISGNFVAYTVHGLFGNGIVATMELLRLSVFSEARFMWQRMTDGRPGDLRWTKDLRPLDEPWSGGTTGDLLARFLLHADLAGNGYIVRSDDGTELVGLRPDWCELILAPRDTSRGKGGSPAVVGYRKVGMIYTEGGPGSGNEPALYLPGEVAHFAPYPDPLATYRGMSWLTPVIREIQTDGQATRHKSMFFENGATPNLAVVLKNELTPEMFDLWVEKMEAQHAGVKNAYRTLYLAGGADVSVVGADMQAIDFKSTQGAGETRIANAAGVHPVVAGLSEGMQGSSLNAGNYQAAKRSTVDRTFRPLWRNVAGSLAVLFRPPRGHRLWYDSRDIPFLRDDAKDVAEVQASEAVTIRTLVDAGYAPDSAVAAVRHNDWSLLRHSGLYSVQLQPAGSGQQDEGQDEGQDEDQDEGQDEGQDEDQDEEEQGGA